MQLPLPFNYDVPIVDLTEKNKPFTCYDCGHMLREHEDEKQGACLAEDCVCGAFYSVTDHDRIEGPDEPTRPKPDFNERLLFLRSLPREWLNAEQIRYLDDRIDEVV